MTSTTTRIITIALAILAVAAPVAGAAPIRDHDGRPAKRAHVYVIPASAFKPQPVTTAPAPRAKPPATDSGDPSPLVYILPSLALIAMLGAATMYVRASRRPAQV